VILVDANLLIYARSTTSPDHAAAQAWLDSRLNGSAPVGLPWPSLLAFVRITTNPRIFPQPLAMSAAWQQVEEWLDCEPAWIPTPTERHRALLGPLLPQAAGRADLVSDAHLAALAIEHGLILCSTDGDFARFPGLRWENPLRAAAP
jgi:toxin-antitoxin system PIN domain toxin